MYEKFRFLLIMAALALSAPACVLDDESDDLARVTAAVESGDGPLVEFNRGPDSVTEGCGDGMGPCRCEVGAEPGSAMACPANAIIGDEYGTPRLTFGTRMICVPIYVPWYRWWYPHWWYQRWYWSGPWYCGTYEDVFNREFCVDGDYVFPYWWRPFGWHGSPWCRWWFRLGPWWF